MRPLEILLVLANLVTFPGLVLLQPRGRRWMKYSAPLGVLIAVAQIAIEGARWRIWPAYALSLLFLASRS